MTPLLDDVAGAILDGTAIEWDLVGSRAERMDRPLIEQLKTLEALRGAGRSTGGNGGDRLVQWGHLRVLERIGQGAFGEVYRAWDSRLDREVALKLLPWEPTSADPEGSSIIEEGRLLARVRHPNVATIYGAERIDRHIGLWMEFVKGRTLEEALRDGSTFNAAAVARLGVDLCRALSAVHAAGLLHRDVKAQNVMLADDGRLVLTDFGTGLEAHGASDANAVGTPLYLAPEVLAGGPASVRSDIYALGVLLYRLLTRAYPVQGQNLSDLRHAHAARGRRESGDVGRALPRRLRSVVVRALDPDPERRYADAGALERALRARQRAPVRAAAWTAAAASVVVALTGLLGWNVGGRDLLARAGIFDAAAVEPSAMPAIVVLPFKNLSSEPDSEYFVDGLTSEVIRNLAAIDGLQVRSQTSSFYFKNQPRDLPAIAERLGVDFAVEADVLRVGNELRVNAQLIQIAGDVPLWSERFERTLDDVFAIQDEMSRAIVNRLRLTLGRGQRRYQTSAAVYENYLRARTLLARGGTANAQRAAEFFAGVIARDPAFAPAHAGLAAAYAEMSWQLDGLSYEDGLSGMRPAAIRALDLDPLLAEAHAAMGLTYVRELEWDRATASFERALALNANLPEIHLAYAESVLTPLGQLQRARELVEAAETMDPLSLAVRFQIGRLQHLSGRHEEAAATARQILAEDREFPFTNQLLARALTAAGRPEEAIAVWQARPSSDGDWQRWITRAYVDTARHVELRRLVEAHAVEHPFRQAIVFAALGDRDQAIDALSRAADLTPHRTAIALVHVEMAQLRGDPRLDAVRAKLRLPPRPSPVQRRAGARDSR